MEISQIENGAILDFADGAPLEATIWEAVWEGEEQIYFSYIATMPSDKGKGHIVYPVDCIKLPGETPGEYLVDRTMGSLAYFPDSEGRRAAERYFEAGTYADDLR